jgi:hypothetical protein
MAKVESEEFSSQFNLDKLTSDVFGVDFPPTDWADMGLLIPHECIRQEMHHMLASVDSLNRGVAQKTIQPWQALYFCEWIVDTFEPFIHEHHDIEEEIYFAWIQTKGNIPEKRFSKCHEDLIKQLDEIAAICGQVIQKKGVNCESEVKDLWEKIHVHVPEMKSK